MMLRFLILGMVGVTGVWAQTVEEIPLRAPLPAATPQATEEVILSVQ